MSRSSQEQELPRLLRQLDSDDMHKRINAIEALGDVGDDICLQELRIRMKLLHDEYQAFIVAVGKLKKRLGVK